MRYKEPRGRKEGKMIYVVVMYFFSLPLCLFYNEDKLSNPWWERGRTCDVPMHPGFLEGGEQDWTSEVAFFTSSALFYFF